MNDIKNKFIFKNFKINIGTFIKGDIYLNKLFNKVKFIGDFVGFSLFFFKRRDLLPSGAAHDRIVSRSIVNCLNRSPEFKGFCRVKQEQFEAAVLKRSNYFSKPEKKALKAKAIAEQLKPSQFQDINIRSYRRAYVRVQEHLMLKEAGLEVATVEEAVQSLNLQAGAGFPFFVKKVHVLIELLITSKSLFTNFTEEIGEAIMQFPSYVAYRVQQRPSDVKLRLIYVYPGVITVFEQLFLQPLVSHFLTKDTPYAIGLNGDELTSRWKYWQQKANQVSIDWEGFDWRANSYLIQDSFRMLRSSFKTMTLTQNLIFSLVEWYFIHTPILTTNPSKGLEDQDEIVFKRRGVPSGSSFTNLIGTIVNMLATYYYFEVRNLKIDARHCSALGDDIIIATNYAFDLGHFAEMSEHCFGMQVSVSKSQVFRKGQKVYFLGALIDGNGRYINPELALYQLSTSTSDLFIKCNTSQEHFDRIHDKMCSLLFKYSDGWKIYDYLVVEIRSYLGCTNTSEYYTEVYNRATAVGLKFTPQKRSIDFMKRQGWRIQ